MPKQIHLFLPLHRSCTFHLFIACDVCLLTMLRSWQPQTLCGSQLKPLAHQEEEKCELGKNWAFFTPSDDSLNAPRMSKNGFPSPDTRRPARTHCAFVPGWALLYVSTSGTKHTAAQTKLLYGKFIWLLIIMKVVHFHIFQNSILQDGSSVACWRVLLLERGSSSRNL